MACRDGGSERRRRSRHVTGSRCAAGRRLSTQSLNMEPWDPTTTDDRDRWTALLVLCAGMLMVVLDATVVNVALPSIQADLGFTAVVAGVGRQRLPHRLRRAAPARRSSRGPVSAACTVFLAGLITFTVASIAVRPGSRPRARPYSLAARFVQGAGGALASVADPRHDRDHVPGAAGAGQGDRRLLVRRLGGRLDRPPGRRRPHRCRSAGTGSSSSTCRSASPPARRALKLPGRRLAGRRARRAGRRRPRRGAGHGGAHAARLHDRRAPRPRTGGRPGDAHARAPSRSHPCCSA